MSAPSGNAAGTPIKAITSSLALRAAPSIPPASQAYEPHLKSVLRRRLLSNVFIVSASFCWVLAAVWTSWQMGGVDTIGVKGWITNVFNPLTLLFAALWWAAACIPITVMRRTYISSSPCVALSPKQTIHSQVSQQSYRFALASLLCSSVVVLACHTFMSYVVEVSGRGDPKLGIWTNSKKHPFHLNGRFVFLVMAQFVASGIYWVRDILKDRFFIRWSRNVTSVSLEAIPVLTASVMSIGMMTVFSTTVTVILFAVSRIVVLPILYRIPIVHGILRPFIAHFLRPKFTVTFLWTHFAMILRAHFISLTTLLLWEVTSVMFDITSSMAVIVSDGVKDSAVVLISGISSSNGYYRLHAFHDLASLSSLSAEAKAKRSAIYSDTKHNPTLWSSICRQCLLLLGQDYQLFLRKGQPAPAPAPAPAPVPPKPTQNLSTPLIRKPIFKSSAASPTAQLADSLSSDGAITQVLAKSPGDAIGLPELFKSASDVIGSPARSFTALIKKTKAPTPDAGSFWKNLDLGKYMPLKGSAAAEWWSRERKDKEVRKCLPNRDLDCMAVEVLCTLIAHSFEEDTFGVVQRDIPRALEALLSFLSALEEYQRQLGSLLPVWTAEEEEGKTLEERTKRELLRIEVERAGDWLDGLTTALRTGIVLIVHTFGPRLTAFKFPPKIAAKLQCFVDYST
ncbi:hypothetical protein SCHPADRAFT_849874 [Schizopora paradoxa]|uniref:Nucleoporin NDC1 n=1 Tax=Schizopora paradoxa TaxID=27342 RepID=A0A0H2RT47_9AGAM|nr:hypothetical protein SCHPADRAFT_849874 [Schizopora paradoxa]